MDIELRFSTESVLEAGPLDSLTVDPRLSIEHVLRLMRNYVSGSVLVCSDGQLLGIFTERDALRLMARGCDMSAPISTAMVENPITIRSDSSIAQAILRMSSGGYRRLPIVDGNGCATGVVQVAGIIHFLAELFPRTVYNQPPVNEPVAYEREGP
ncbi:MAG: CBS domain-containing protein [Planctomycetes bacterium]|nr:CBS domain-containing protein [Planctomycetota bacterium]